MKMKMAGSSALRNAVKRVTHKERAQPAARKKLGLLEKHKDYVLRAKDYHKKKNFIKTLKKKAADRNPDEFYFKMHNSQVSNGLHKELKDATLDQETVKLLKTQDMGYIVHKASVDSRKIEKLQNSLHLIGDVKPKMHQIFVNTKEEVENFDPVKHFDTVPELVDRAHNRPKVETLEKGVYVSRASKADIKKVTSKTTKAYAELDQRIKRRAKLRTTMTCLQLQRNLMGKGTKKKVGEGKDGVPVFKWKRQRSK